MLLLFLLLALIAANLLFGSVSLPMSEVIAALMGDEAPEAVRIIVC
jgi:ABC-type enterobactin transport system permease subunit